MPPKVTKLWVPANTPGGASASLVPGVGGGGVDPDADRLSALPDALLHHIMSFMKAWDVVRTCVLSRRWRDLWASAPCVDVRVGRYSEPPDDFVKFVYRLLLAREVLAPVDTLRLRSPGEDDEDFNTDDVKMWIRHAIKRKARVIQLNGHINLFAELDPMDLVSRHLKILKLSYADVFDNFIWQLSSRCPSLEELELKSCLVEAHEITSASLKSLTMVKCTFIENFSVDAPNLVFLRCIAPETWVPLFKNFGSLVTVSVMLDDSLLSADFDKYHQEDEFAQTSDEDVESAQTSDEDDESAQTSDEDDESAQTSDEDDESAQTSDEDDESAQTSDEDDESAQASDEDDESAQTSDEDDEFSQTSDEDDEFAQTSDDDDDNNSTHAQRTVKNVPASDDSDEFSSDDIKGDYDYGSDINSDSDTYEYSEIANGCEDRQFGNHDDGRDCNKGSKYHGCSTKDVINDYKKLGGQNFLHSLSNARSLELLGHSGEVILRRESISSPTFNNLKTLALGEWCINTGADFDILILLLQHSPNLEKLFLQLEMDLDIQKALGRGIKPNGGSFDCKYLRMVKIRCTKDDPRVHMLAQFRSN